MKKIQSVLILLISLSINAQTTVNLKTDIRGRGCSGGLGICSLTGGGAKSIGQTYGQRIDKHSFLLIIERSKISHQEELSLVGKSISELNRTVSQQFKMEGEVMLDEQTVKQLGLEYNFNIIPTGNFPLTFDDEKIYIRINVVKNKQS